MSQSKFGITVATLLCIASVRGHEIGTSRVSAVFHEGGAYEVEIVTDATALAEKLEASNGGSLHSKTSAAELLTLLVGFDEVFRQRVKIAFDGLEVRPETAYSVEPAIDATSARGVDRRGQCAGGEAEFLFGQPRGLTPSRA